MSAEINPWIYCCMLYLMRVLQSRPLYSYFTRRQSAINIISLHLKTYATDKFQIKYRNQPPASDSTKTRNILLKLEAAVTSHPWDWLTPSLLGEHVHAYEFKPHTDISYSPQIRRIYITFPIRPLTSNWATQIVHNPRDSGGFQFPPFLQNNTLLG